MMAVDFDKSCCGTGPFFFFFLLIKQNKSLNITTVKAKIQAVQKKTQKTKAINSVIYRCWRSNPPPMVTSSICDYKLNARMCIRSDCHHWVCTCVCVVFAASLFFCCCRIVETEALCVRFSCCRLHVT